MAAVASAAAASFKVSTYIASALNTIGNVGSSPDLAALAQAYQFLKALWNSGSSSVNGVNVDFSKIKGFTEQMRENIRTTVKTLFSAYDNVVIHTQDGDVQFTDENGNPLTLKDMIVGRKNDPKFQIQNNNIAAFGAWIDGNPNIDSSCVCKESIPEVGDVAQGFSNFADGCKFLEKYASVTSSDNSRANAALAAFNKEYCLDFDL